MNWYPGLIGPILLYFIITLVLICGLLFISYFLGPKTLGRETATPYESGILSVGSARVKFTSHFFLFAIFFVIFDLETVFLFAWAIAFKEAGLLGFIEASIFIAILLIALLYLWRIGALELLSRHKTKSLGTKSHDTKAGG